MRKEIPKEVHIYCDRCGSRCYIDENFKRDTSVTINRGETDYMWEYHNHTTVYELCDKCSDIILACIKGNK